MKNFDQLNLFTELSIEETVNINGGFLNGSVLVQNGVVNTVTEALRKFIKEALLDKLGDELSLGAVTGAFDSLWKNIFG